MTDSFWAEGVPAMFASEVERAAQGRLRQDRLAATIADIPLIGLRLEPREPTDLELRRARRALGRLLPPRQQKPVRIWTPPPFVFIRSRVEREGEDIPLDYVYERDGRLCHICRKPVRREEATRDHLIPISAGGPHTRVNVIPAQLRLLD